MDSPIFLAHRYRLKPSSNIRFDSLSTPQSGSRMPFSKIDNTRAFSAPGQRIRQPWYRRSKLVISTCSTICRPLWRVFLKTRHTVGQFYGTVDAVLSQNSIQHGKNLRHIDPTALYQTGNKPDMFHCRVVNATSAIFIQVRFRQSVLLAAAGIQMLLLYLAFRAPIIFDAPVYGILAPVSRSATKRTAKIVAAGIAWVGKKQDLTMPALGQALSQVWLFLENRPDNPVILRSDAADLLLAVPVRNELKTRLDLYYKKAKCSLISLMYLGIPSLSFFYFAINKVQRGFFFCKA